MPAFDQELVTDRDGYMRAKRLCRRTRALLAAARRGEMFPDVLDLQMLHSLLTDAGAYELADDVRRYLLQLVGRS